MALSFSAPQLALLKSKSIKASVLVTFWFPSGTYRFCDDVHDTVYAGNTYIGASALAEITEIRGGQQFSAEPVTLTVDGNRLHQSGFTDPAALFRNILAEKYRQRRVDIDIGLTYPDSSTLQLVIPVYAGKVNYMLWTDSKSELESKEPTFGKLEIILDSLAARYDRATHRTRSHADQQELFPGDDFFSFVATVGSNEQTLYWGKDSPLGHNSGAGGTYSGGGGGYRNPPGNADYY